MLRCFSFLIKQCCNCRCNFYLQEIWFMSHIKYVLAYFKPQLNLIFQYLINISQLKRNLVYSARFRHWKFDLFHMFVYLDDLYKFQSYKLLVDKELFLLQGYPSLMTILQITGNSILHEHWRSFALFSVWFTARRVKEETFYDK